MSSSQSNTESLVVGNNDGDFHITEKPSELCVATHVDVRYADLFAAAPELLAACKWALRCARVGSDIYVALRTAIHNAEGIRS